MPWAGESKHHYVLSELEASLSHFFVELCLPMASLYNLYYHIRFTAHVMYSYFKVMLPDTKPNTVKH